MSNLNLNKVVLCGRLTADPELKKTQSGVSVLSFNLAINRKFAREENGQKVYDADFISCVAWRQCAEFITKYFKKGSSICLTGSLQTRMWIDNNDVKHYATDVVVEEAMFVDARSDNKAGQASYVPEAYTNSSSSNEAPAELVEDDLPL